MAPQTAYGVRHHRRRAGHTGGPDRSDRAKDHQHRFRQNGDRKDRFQGAWRNGDHRPPEPGPVPPAGDQDPEPDDRRVRGRFEVSSVTLDRPVLALALPSETLRTKKRKKQPPARSTATILAVASRT